jgi:hypothetical protein
MFFSRYKPYILVHASHKRTDSRGLARLSQLYKESGPWL